MWLLYQFATDTATYGQTIHRSGLWSVGLLFAAMAITPLRRRTNHIWIVTIARFRRAIGVASFGYAVVHTGVYLEHKWGAGLIVKEGLEAELATGWLALGVFLMLALTSNDTSTRLLGKKWKRLHRSVYGAAALIFAHWILTSFDATIAYVCLVLLVFVEMLRISRWRLD